MNYEKSIREAINTRPHLFQMADTNCFRIFNQSGDGIEGLTIDLYANFLLFQYFNDEISSLLENFEFIKFVLSEIPVEIKGVLIKNRIKISGNKNYNDIRKSQLISGSDPTDNLLVIQNKINVNVDLVNGQSSGIFLDMREVRDELGQFYSTIEKSSFLNLFSYTSVFSMHALKNGFAEGINVDLSKPVLNKSKKNYISNDLIVDNRDFIHGDSIQWIKTFIKKEKKFSLIFFDPPTFSRNKKRNFSVKNDYKDTLFLLEKISSGYILTSINSHSITEEEYFSYHPNNWKNLMYMKESSDFKSRENPYLKVGLWKVD